MTVDLSKMVAIRLGLWDNINRCIRCKQEVSTSAWYYGLLGIRRKKMHLIWLGDKIVHLRIIKG